MKRFLIIAALAAMLCPLSAFAQGQFNPGGATARAFQSGTSVPATCTEGMVFYDRTGNLAYLCTATNTWVAFTNGAAVSPSAPTGSLQYNNAGAFGAIPTAIRAGSADCDGFMDPCAFTYNNVAATFEYLIYGTETGGMMGNTHDFYYNNGCWTFDTSDGTLNGSMYICPTSGNLASGFGATHAGYDIKQDFLSVSFSRFMFDTNTGQTPQTTDVALSAGWGDAAVVSQIRGSDNNPEITILSDGTGQGANPTAAFTFHNGAFGNTAQSWVGVCQQRGGTGTIADIAWSSSTTVLTLTYRGTPVDNLTYILSCFGAVSGDN